MTKLSIKNLVMCAMFIALITVGAFIKVPLFYGDYFTLQTLFVLLSGLLLGYKLGTVAVLVYVLMGLIGIPVFAGGGGIGYILKPSFGYLVGFVLGAFTTGYIVHKLNKISFIKLLLATLLGLIVIYGIGLVFKYFILNFYLATPMNAWSLILLCFPIDIPCDIVLCFIAALLAKQLIPILRKNNLSIHVQRRPL